MSKQAGRGRIAGYAAAALAYALVALIALVAFAAPGTEAGSPDPARLYGSSALAALAVVTVLTADFFRLGRPERPLLLLLRLGLSAGGVFVSGYYALDRLALPPVPAILLTTALLFAGQIILGHIPIETLLYLVFGLMTTVVAIVSFNLVNWLLYGTILGGGNRWGWFVPKLVSWTAAVLFAFWTNRRWVFYGSGHWFRELVTFAAGRLASGLVIEFAGLYALENLAGMPRDLANLLTALLVVIVNYFFSRFVVFRRQTKEQGAGRQKETL
ncbi:MAG: GtrA family protein [Bacillota bacterium]|nr:GtrA family protein [Bacillota bacterium]